MRSRVLLSLALMAVAATGAVGGSYATWSNQVSNPGNSVTAGFVTLENDKTGTSIFMPATNIRPGSAGFGTVVVNNKAGANQLPLLATISQTGVSSTFSSSLVWSLHDQTRDWCYWPTNAAGACPALEPSGGAWNATASLASLPLRPMAGTSTDPWPAGESHTFRVDWLLRTNSPNADQGATASFGLAWTGTQVA